MPQDFSKFAPVMFALLLAWLVYRRFRRTFGRQALSRKRMAFQVVFFLILAALLAPLGFKSWLLVAAMVAGFALGVLLALWGASQTRFERDGAQVYYVPHIYSGIAVSLLFLGRLTYRYLQGLGGPVVQSSVPAGDNPVTAFYGQSPLTLDIFFVLVGYYVCYYSLVLYKARHLDDTGAGLAELPARGDSSKPA